VATGIDIYSKLDYWREQRTGIDRIDNLFSGDVFMSVRTVLDLKASALKKVVLTCSIAVCLIGGQSSTNAGTPLQKVTLAYAAISPNMSGVWMAKEISAYEKYGLQANLVFIASGGITVASLISGDLDMAVAASNAAISAIYKGAPIVAVGSVTNRPGQILWVQPEISSPSELQGKALGISRIGSMSHFLTLLTLQKFGLQGKVNIQQHGDGPSLDIAFHAGLIAGRLSSLRPDSRARPLADLADLGIPYATNYITVSHEYLKKNRKTVEALLMAYTEGVAALHKRKQRAIEVLNKYLRRSSTDEEPYSYAIKYLERYPRVDPETIQTVLSWMKISDASVNRFFDNSIIENLNQQGFVDKLYH
jgi:NitT/TauT family transport system substrate-binding protein